MTIDSHNIKYAYKLNKVELNHVAVHVLRDIYFALSNSIAKSLKLVELLSSVVKSLVSGGNSV